MAKSVPYTLYDDFEYSGIWWIPDDTANQVAGQLKFEAGETITLELIGAFSDFPLAHDFKAEVVHGITTDGNLCTLIGFITSDIKGNWPGFAVQSIRFQFLFFGKHIDSLSDFSVTTYQVSFSNLDGWVGKSPIKSESKSPEKPIGLLEKPPVRRLYLPQIDGELQVDYSSQTHHGLMEFKISAEAVIRFQPDQPRGFSQLHSVFSEIERFLVLMIGHPTTARRIWLVATGNEKEIVYLFHTLRTPIRRKLHTYQMMLPFSMVEEHLATAANGWFDRAEILKPVYNLLLGFIYRPDVFVEFGFLALTQALEAYHRISYPMQVYMSDEEYRPILIELQNSIPPVITGDWRVSMNNRLRYGNQYSLRKRLNQLLRNLPTELVNLVTENQNVFVDEIVEIRNQITHPEESFTAKEGNPGKLVILSGKMRLLLTMLLLQEIGFDQSTVKLAAEQLTQRILPRPLP